MTSKTPQDLVRSAEKAYQAGQYIEAAELFGLAAERHVQAGNSLLAAEQSNNRSVALLQAGDAANALLAAQGTENIFAQAGDTKRQALAYGNQAAAVEALGRLDEALGLYRQCAELLKQVGDNETRGTVLKKISALQIRTGHQLEALASMESALKNTSRLSLRERLLKKLLDIPFRMLRGG